MAGEKARGGKGEAFAKSTLEAMGYRVVACNYHSRYGEIDLVAHKGEIISFVEVKTRREHSMVAGQEAVTRAKQRKIISTALLYLQEFPSSLQPSFDVFTVVTDKQGRIIRYDYIMGAFDGGAYGW